MGNRKAAEKIWMDFVIGFEKRCLLPYLKEKGGDVTRNQDLYKELFATMSDEEFDKMMVRIRDKETFFPLFVPNMDDMRIDPDLVMEYGKELGAKFFHRIIFIDPLTGMEVMSEKEHLCLYQSTRRQSQHLEYKISTSENDKKVDVLTGQATGDSKSASMSQPEILILGNKGHVKAAVELVNVKGGNDKAYQNMIKQISETGGFSVEAAIADESRPKVVASVAKFLRGAHIDNNV